jgi:hypothetical protein
MERSPRAAVDEVLARTEPVIDRLKQGGGEADLRELRQALCQLPGEIERDPDINGAAQDLCDAAEALVADHSAGAHPSRARQEGHLRLFCEMHLRFHTRLMEIAASKSGAPLPRI